MSINIDLRDRNCESQRKQKVTYISDYSSLTSKLYSEKDTIYELVIEEGCGNDIHSDLCFTGLYNLKVLRVRTECFRNISDLEISNNNSLEIIEIEDGKGWSSYTGSLNTAFENVCRVVIKSIKSLMEY